MEQLLGALCEATAHGIEVNFELLIGLNVWTTIVSSLNIPWWPLPTGPRTAECERAADRARCIQGGAASTSEAGGLMT